jgi:DNA-binding CsgD family transcriptional regulator
VVSAGVVAADPIDRLTRLRSSSTVRHAAALLGISAAVAGLELSVLGLDHGTHLLVVLTLIVGIAVLLGPGPAITGFATGGCLAVIASLMTVRDVLSTPHTYIQLLAYLLTGSAFIALVSVAIRTRRRPSTPPGTALANAAASQDLVEPLTARELEILRLAATGISVDEMARVLFVSPNTVKTHLTHVYAKLGVRGRADAVRAALHCGCLTPNDICPHLLAPGTEGSPVPVIAERRNG